MVRELQGAGRVTISPPRWSAMADTEILRVVLSHWCIRSSAPGYTSGPFAAGHSAKGPPVLPPQLVLVPEGAVLRCFSIVSGQSRRRDTGVSCTADSYGARGAAHSDMPLPPTTVLARGSTVKPGAATLPGFTAAVPVAAQTLGPGEWNPPFSRQVQGPALPRPRTRHPRSVLLSPAAPAINRVRRHRALHRPVPA